jgi:hypothetical protein
VPSLFSLASTPCANPILPPSAGPAPGPPGRREPSLPAGRPRDARIRGRATGRADSGGRSTGRFEASGTADCSRSECTIRLTTPWRWRRMADRDRPFARRILATSVPRSSLFSPRHRCRGSPRARRLAVHGPGVVDPSKGPGNAVSDTWILCVSRCLPGPSRSRPGASLSASGLPYPSGPISVYQRLERGSHPYPSCLSGAGSTGDGDGRPPGDRTGSRRPDRGSAQRFEIGPGDPRTVPDSALASVPELPRATVPKQSPPSGPAHRPSR